MTAHDSAGPCPGPGPLASCARRRSRRPAVRAAIVSLSRACRGDRQRAEGPRGNIRAARCRRREGVARVVGLPRDSLPLPVREQPAGARGTPEPARAVPARARAEDRRTHGGGGRQQGDRAAGRRVPDWRRRTQQLRHHGGREARLHGAHQPSGGAHGRAGGQGRRAPADRGKGPVVSSRAVSLLPARRHRASIRQPAVQSRCGLRHLVADRGHGARARVPGDRPGQGPGTDQGLRHGPGVEAAVDDARPAGRGIGGRRARGNGDLRDAARAGGRQGGRIPAEVDDRRRPLLSRFCRRWPDDRRDAEEAHGGGSNPPGSEDEVLRLRLLPVRAQ